MIPEWLYAIFTSVSAITGVPVDDVVGEPGVDTRVTLSREVVTALIQHIQELEIEAAGRGPTIMTGTAEQIDSIISVTSNGDEMYLRAKRAIEDLREVRRVQVDHERDAKVVTRDHGRTEVVITIRGYQ